MEEQKIQDRQADTDAISSELRDFAELRILKERGFFGVTLPVVVRIPGADAQTAANYTTPFFIANRNYVVVAIEERHETAGSDGGAVTVTVNKVPSGTAPGSGTALLSSAINLKATANTNQTGTLSTTQGVTTISDGTSLALVSSGTLTAVVGVTVSVLLKAI